MITFDMLAEWLDDIVDALPDDLYRELNGGINLSPDVKIHPESNHLDDLYVLGTYHNDPNGLGRYIMVYYGSFVKLYEHLPTNRQKERLKKVVYHELTHHMESLAGEKDLEMADAQDLAAYKQRIQRHREQA